MLTVGYSVGNEKERRRDLIDITYYIIIKLQTKSNVLYLTADTGRQKNTKQRARHLLTQNQAKNYVVFLFQRTFLQVYIRFSFQFLCENLV